MAPPSSFLSPNFPILAIIISGILTTTFILLSFYFFITKCHLRNTTSAQNTPAVPIFPQLKPQGLKPSLIRAIPIAKFSKSSISAVICTICLNEFHAEEKLRILPNCSHAFHIDCIDTWLQSNTNCPLCRVSVTNPILRLKQTHGITSDNEREDEEEENYFMRREALIKEKKRSLGDECIIHVRENEEELRVQPLRRSLSMDSSSERQIYLSVQEMLKKRQNYQSEIEEGGECSMRSVQTCFSFSQSRTWRKPVIPAIG